MAEQKRIFRSGTLILEGGLRLRFEETFNHPDDVHDWIVALDDFELPTDEIIFVKEEGTVKSFYIPREKVIAYSLDQ